MSEEKVTIGLSAPGMHRLYEHDRDRLSVVGDRDYECGVLEARFLSPNVSLLLLGDCTVNSISLEGANLAGCFD